MTEQETKVVTEEDDGRKLVSLFEGTGPVTLKKHSKKVNVPLSEEDRQLAADLLEYTIKEDGLGMAAIQLGEEKRIFVAELPVGGRKLQVVVNPVIHKMGGKRKRIEGCFSIPLPPGQGMMMQRPSIIVVSYYDEDGNLFENVELKGANAQVFLHEFSHLEGFTMMDDSPYGKNLGLASSF